MPIERRKEGRTEYGLRNRATGANPAGLMLIHVTPVGAAREILKAGQITVRRCRVFERELVYFFLLRPAYRLKDSHEKRGLIDFFPFVFIFDPTLMSAPYHVYPFDTGGAINGAFDAAHSPYVPLEDYALEETLQGAADHILWAFDTRAAYFDGRLRPSLSETLPAWDSHGHTFIEIARLAAEGSNRPDLRASSIEVAYAHHAPLSPHAKFAVLPRQFLEDPRGNNAAMVDALTASGIEWETYDWRPNRAPEEFHIEVNAIVRGWLASRGML
jgi:hypothetical protein